MQFLYDQKIELRCEKFINLWQRKISQSNDIHSKLNPTICPDQGVQESTQEQRDRPRTAEVSTVPDVGSR